MTANRLPSRILLIPPTSTPPSPQPPAPSPQPTHWGLYNLPENPSLSVSLCSGWGRRAFSWGFSRLVCFSSRLAFRLRCKKNRDSSNTAAMRALATSQELGRGYHPEMDAVRSLHLVDGRVMLQLLLHENNFTLHLPFRVFKVFKDLRISTSVFTSNPSTSIVHR
ncbi:hypothetical protein H6P81_011409 [Aristolochia fimbriata]|uniref:Uncharacterized protein n=1 Tax=Aristolochia fimbriata TaxID=158543 RepID=A0AAV7ES95_ARIFI|nr:hypothetical protein H6P81_011409 [Aristolochia fimbriata]